MARHVYHITASNGHVFEVEADDDAQAHRLSTFIESRIAAGDPEVTGGEPPDNAQRREAALADPTSSATRAAVNGFTQGGYFNWGDELTAWGDANIPGLAALDNATSGGDRRYGGFALLGNQDPTAYEHNLAVERGQMQADEAQHPTAYHLANIGGTAASVMAPEGRLTRLMADVGARVLPRAAIPIAARAAAASIGAPIRFAAARGALTGGAIGAASGAGAGDGNRLQSAALGGLAGAGAGMVLDPLVSSLVPAIGRYARALFGQMPHEEALAQIMQSLRRDGFDLTRPASVQALRTELARFGGRPVSLADIGAATRARAGVGLRSPSDVQQQSIDQVLARSQGQGVRLRRDILDNVAPRTDVHALNDDLVAQRASEAERLRQVALFEGSPAAPSPASPDHIDLFHVTDADTARRIQQEGYIPGHSSPFSPESDALVPGMYGFSTPQGADDLIRRVVDDGNFIKPEDLATVHFRLPRSEFSGHLRPDEDSLGQTFDESYAGGSGAVEGHIPAQYVVPSGGQGLQTRVIDDPIIRNLMQHPDMRRALPGAIARSRSELELLRATNQPTEHLDAGVLNADQYQQLLESGVAPPDMRALDMIKRHLDDEVSSLYRRGSTSTFNAGEAHQVRGLRDALRERLRQVNPDYGHYLDQYAGSSDMIDALHEGQNFRNLDPEEIAAGQADRSVAGRELYRVGAARDLTDVVNATTDGRNPASRILNSPEARDQLTALGLAPGAPAHLMGAVSQERQLNLLPAELAGSATDARAAARADADITPNVPYISGNPLNWAGAGARWIANHFGTQRMAGVNAELLPRVLETDKAAMDAIISELEQHGGQQLAATLRRNRRANRVVRGYANIIGAPVALPAQMEDR